MKIEQVKNFNIHDKAELQKQYCKQHDLPNFALNGRCFSCGRNVFQHYTAEEAATTHITGCPYCFRSFCD